MKIVKKQYPVIDIFKFIFACLIIFLHIDFGDNIIITVVRSFSHMGVPFFFIASGFFLGEKLIENKPINNLIKRLIFIFVFWTLLYLPLNILPQIVSGENIATVLMNYLQQLIFLAPSYLWYLVALIVAVLLIYLLKNVNSKIQFAIYVLLYIIGTLGNSYRGIFRIDFKCYYDIFLTTRNGVFFALIFVFMGVLISKNETKIKESFNKNQVLNIILTIIAFALYIMETVIVENNINPKDSSMYFSLPILLYLLFKIMISVDIKSKSNKFLYLRNSSLIIYCSQFGFIFVYTYVLKRILILNSLWFGLLIYIITIFSALILTLIIKKVNNKFLNKLI